MSDSFGNSHDLESPGKGLDYPKDKGLKGTDRRIFFTVILRDLNFCVSSDRKLVFTS